MANPPKPDPAGYVAFFRNMNLGQARSRSPGSGELVEAFTAAGAEWVTNFQTNGTVIFSASDPAAVVERVRPQLLAATRYADAVVVRSHAWLTELGPRLDPELHGGEVALFDAPEVPLFELPFNSRVVASSNDPNVSLERAKTFAEAWRSAFTNIGAGGHINGAAGYGDWPRGEAMLKELLF